MATTTSTETTGPTLVCRNHGINTNAACVLCFNRTTRQPVANRLAARRARAEAAYNKALTAYNKAYNDELDYLDLAQRATGW
jgi:hypothetical protein